MAYKKFKKLREYDKPLPKATLLTSVKPSGYCDRAPGVLLQCPYEFRCWACDYAARMRVSFKDDPPPYPTISENSVFADRSRKQYNYFRKVVALKPEAMEQLELKPLLYYQFFKCCDGPGCLPGNYVWEIEGHLLAYPDRTVIIKRSDVLGIPTLDVCKKYDKYFFGNSVRECGYFEGSDV